MVSLKPVCSVLMGAGVLLLFIDAQSETFQISLNRQVSSRDCASIESLTNQIQFFLINSVHTYRVALPNGYFSKDYDSLSYSYSLHGVVPTWCLTPNQLRLKSWPCGKG